MSSQWYELFKRRELLRNLVTRQLKVRYKSSSLGFLWSLLNPLIMALVYWAVFSNLLGGARGMGMDNYKAYLITGLFAWNFFAGSVSDSATSFVGNISLVKKVYFPRIILPVSAVLTNLVNFILSLVIVFALLMIWKIDFGISILMLPVLLLIEFMLACGLAFYISCLNVLFRDVEHMLQVTLLAGFFLTPVIYPYQRVIPEHLHLLYFLNPMACIIAGYQSILYSGEFPPAEFIYIPFVISIIVLVTGYRFLTQLEGLIVDQL